MAKNKTIYNSLTRAVGEVKEGREININKYFPYPLLTEMCVRDQGRKVHEL